MKWLIALVMLVLLLAVSCSREEQQVVTVDRAKIPVAREPAAVEEPTTTKEPVDPKVESLLDKSKEVTSYMYLFDASEPTAYTVYIKGNKIKKVYFDTQRLQSNVFYNTVYLDTEEKTAVATCEESGVSCENYYNKAYPTNYDIEYPRLQPLKMLENVGPDAKVISKERFDNRDLTIIEFTNPLGKSERLSLDNYFGVPVRQVIYVLQDDQEVVLDKHTFTRLDVNNIKNADVTLPEGYAIQ